MPKIARFQMPDGRVGRFEVPDDSTPEQAQALISAHLGAQQGSAAPQKVSQEASAMAAEGMGPLDTLAVAAGRGFDKLAVGVKDAALRGVRAVGSEQFATAADQELAKLAQEEAVKDSGYAGLAKARPILTSIGEAAPAAVATGGMGIVPGALAFGGMEALKPGEVSERLGRGAIAAGSSAAGGYVGQKVAQAVAPVASNAVSAVKRQTLQMAENMGYKPRLSEITGSPYLARLEDMAARTPGGMGIMDDFARGNQNALNRRAAQGIGETADELTPAVMDAAKTRIGQAFNDIKSLPGRPIAIDKNVAAVADDVLRTQAKMNPGQQSAELVALAKQAKALAQNNGKIDGETYQLMRSGLSESAFDASGTNKNLFGRLLEALDASADSSLRSQGMNKLADALKTARPEYGNFKTLTKGATIEGGDVSAAKVASTLRTNAPDAFRTGKMAGNPLYDVAMIGENMKPMRAGSPTYEREVASSLINTLARAPMAYGAAKLTTGAIPRAYVNALATNQLANALTQPVALSAEPSGRLMANYLAQRFLLPAPVLAE